MRLPYWELEKLRMEHEEKEAEQARQRAEEQYWKKTRASVRWNGDAGDIE